MNEARHREPEQNPYTSWSRTKSKVGPENLQGGQREHSVAILILKSKTDKKKNDLRQVGGQKMEKELYRQNHVRRLFGNVATTVSHGNTDVSLLEGRRIVDTITSHDTERLAAMERLNHADLGQRATTGEDNRQLIKTINLSVAESSEVSGSHDGVGLQANILVEDTDFIGDGCSGLDMITSDHVDSNTSSAALLHGTSGLRARRVIESSKANELEIILNLGAIMAVLNVAVHGLGCNADLCELCEENLNSALGIDVSGVLNLVAVHNTHKLAGRIEGMLSHQGITPGDTTTEPHGENLESNLSGLTNGLPISIVRCDNTTGVGLWLFLSITNSRVVAKGKNLEESVQVASGQISRPLDSTAIATEPDFAGNHSSLSQSAGLVRADVGNTTNSLQRRHLTDNNITADHCFGSNGHGNCQDGEERLGNDSHADTDSVKKNLIGDLPKTNGEDDNGKENGEGEQQQGELAKGNLKRRSLKTKNSAAELIRPPYCATDGCPFGVVVLGLAQELGDLTDLGLHSSSNNDTSGTATGDRASGIGEVDTITHGHVRVGEDNLWLLADGDRFTSQKCLIGGNVDALNQTQVGRDNITGSEGDYVALDEGFGLDSFTLTISDDLALRSGHKNIPDNNVKDNDGGHDGTLNIVRDSKGQSGHGDKDDSQGIGNLLDENLIERNALGAFDRIRAVPLKAGSSLFATQTIVNVRLEVVSDTVSRERMGKNRFLCD
ncbi:hypothetical protein HG530_005438 [Fusarium avenaceum]|nr:hypothetical protein HG530_005438 [Fusarium avenaceum]